MAYLNKFVEPVSNWWPITNLRERAMKNLMEHIHYEDENSNYVGLCPINKVIIRSHCCLNKGQAFFYLMHYCLLLF
uniref:Uncharacterized protein n=1 Tax=Setaria italica TaxID=4555 RepID=K3YFA8_SETIT